MKNVVDKKEKYKTMQFALECGRYMLENGGETYRAEDIMDRICKSRHLKDAYPYVTPTVVQLSINDEDNYSFIYRVRNRGTNLEKISLINCLVRRFTLGEIGLTDARESLKKITEKSIYNYLMKVFWSGIIGGSFAILFMGGYKDLVAAFIVTIFSQSMYYFISEKFEATHMAYVASGVLIGFLSVFFSNYIVSSSVDKVISGAVMPTVPGVALTNGIRDLLSGDLASGIARLMDALIIATFIAFGVSSGMGLYSFLFL